MGLLVALAAGACAAPTGDVQNKPALAGGGSVCVASAIGHRFEVQTIGVMVFGNDLQTAAIGSWGIDEMAVSKIATLLGPNFTVRQIGYPKGAIEDLEAPRRELFRDYAGEFNAVLRAAAASAPKCDFYITVTRGATQFANTNQTLQGLGVLKRDAGIVKRYQAFAMIRVRLFDGNSFTMKPPKVDIGDVLVKGLTGSGIRGPSSELAETDWPATPQAAVQSAKLRDITRALVDKDLAESVPALF